MKECMLMPPGCKNGNETSCSPAAAKDADVEGKKKSQHCLTVTGKQEDKELSNLIRNELCNTEFKHLWWILFHLTAVQNTVLLLIYASVCACTVDKTSPSPEIKTETTTYFLPFNISRKMQLENSSSRETLDTNSYHRYLSISASGLGGRAANRITSRVFTFTEQTEAWSICD